MINYDLTKIRAIFFDVDGVLSRQTITLHPSGEPMRTVNIKDGYAMQHAVKHQFLLAVITGGTTEAVQKRSLIDTDMRYNRAIIRIDFRTVPERFTRLYSFCTRHCTVKHFRCPKSVF